MESQSFKFKYLDQGKLSKPGENYNVFSKASIRDENYLEDVLSQYEDLHIPKKIENLIDQFCDLYDAGSLKKEILTLICYIQKKYQLITFYNSHSEGSYFKGVMYESKDLKKLLDLLGQFYYRNENIIRQISFNSNNKTHSIKIKNLIVIKDILNGIGLNYDLSKLSESEYSTKASELIDLTNDIDHRKFHSSERKNCCVVLNNFLENLSIGKNQRWKVIGALITISQFSFNNIDDEILMSTTFTDYLDEIPPQNIRNILIRPADSSLK